MSKAAKDAARRAKGDPAVLRWTERLMEVARDMPPNVHVFVASGSVCVVAKDEKGGIFERGKQGGLDQDALVECLDRNLGRWDGGDW